MIVTSREVNIEVPRGSFQRAIVVRMLEFPGVYLSLHGGTTCVAS